MVSDAAATTPQTRRRSCLRRMNPSFIRGPIVDRFSQQMQPAG
jgi:hypothetical protein